MKCTKCGCELCTELESDMEICIDCAEIEGILEPECYCCGAKLNGDEVEVGLGLCFACIDETNDI